MNIDDVINIANAVDPGAASFKANSTRESRNAKWAEIISIVHYGHPVFNRNPDSSWFLKSAGGGRPQSDDAVVRMPARDFWDCIPFSGTDGARFQATYEGKLPLDQVIITPEKLDNPVPIPNPEPEPEPEPIPDYTAKLNEILENQRQFNEKLNVVISLLSQHGEQLDQLGIAIEDLRAHLDNRFDVVRAHQNTGRHKVGW